MNKPKNFDFSNIHVFLITFLINTVFSIIFLYLFAPYLGISDDSQLLNLYDGKTYDAIALEKQISIEYDFFTNFELFPKDHFPAGVASLIYFLFGHLPIANIILNCLLFSFALVLIFRLLNQFVSNEIAFFTSIVLCILPSSQILILHINKDIYAALGFLSIICSIFFLEKYNLELLKIFLIAIFGVLILWASRPYIIEDFLLITGILAILNVAFVKNDQRKINKLCLIIILFSLLFGISNVFNSGHEFFKRPPPVSPPTTHEGQPRFAPPPLETIITVRRNYINDYGDSTLLIDKDYQFSSTLDLVQYLPRAVQIGTIGPRFEKLEPGNKRLFVSIFKAEALIVSIIFLLSSVLLIMKRNIIFLRTSFTIFLISSVMILVFVIAIPNFGTLIRMKAPFLVLIFAPQLAIVFSEFQRLFFRGKHFEQCF